ncbi:MAG: YraN family protein [Defluviitaleaceae bacterium]|nr:YraN family protein [Defluviitaleaceae bacterium]
MKNRRTIGNEWERYSVFFLETKGYNITSRNYYTDYGEIDLIAEYADILIFVEVKFRTSNKFGTGAEAVNYKKQEKIRNSALVYLSENNITNKDVRFDIVEIIGRSDVSFNHIINAF